MPNNTFGKRINYVSKLGIELQAHEIKKLYPDFKDIWLEAHIEAAKLFYLDSFFSKANFAEIGRLQQTANAMSYDGHVQSTQIGHWTPIANDCWVLGGFHSSKIFRLNTLGHNAVWEESRVGKGSDKKPYAFPVTRRELASLLEFGFRPDLKSGTTIVFKSTTPEKAFNATLTQYAEATTLKKLSSKLVNDFIGDWLN